LGIAPFVDMRPEDCSPDTFAPLPFSAHEVRTAAGLMQGEVWTGADATTERFLTAAHSYNVLHLATHSRADNRQGSYSFVAVSQRGPLLTAKDLFALSLAADMVVLSACEAGDGQLLRGEGIIGLVRGFMYAGARSVVASQWVAHDRSSAYLMTNFYRKWQQGAPLDGALRAAQIALLRQHPTYAHPFFWAGYRVYGNR
jgi:CHAT domain-containing protein